MLVPAIGVYDDLLALRSDSERVVDYVCAGFHAIFSKKRPLVNPGLDERPAEGIKGWQRIDAADGQSARCGYCGSGADDAQWELVSE